MLFKKSFFISCFFTGILFGSANLSCSNGNAESIKNLLSLPSFKALLYDSSTLISSQDIPKGKPLIFIYFSPTCDNCQVEIESILAYRNIFRSSRIYLITDDSFEDLQVFAKRLNLTSNSNIIVTKDFEYTFYTHFKPDKIPFIAVYNKNKILTRIFKEQVDVTLIKTALEE